MRGQAPGARTHELRRQHFEEVRQRRGEAWLRPAAPAPAPERRVAHPARACMKVRALRDAAAPDRRARFSVDSREVHATDTRRTNREGAKDASSKERDGAALTTEIPSDPLTPPVSSGSFPVLFPSTTSNSARTLRAADKTCAIGTRPASSASAVTSASSASFFHPCAGRASCRPSRARDLSPEGHRGRTSPRGTPGTRPPSSPHSLRQRTRAGVGRFYRR